MVIVIRIILQPLESCFCAGVAWLYGSEGGETQETVATEAESSPGGNEELLTPLRGTKRFRRSYTWACAGDSPDK